MKKYYKIITIFSILVLVFTVLPNLTAKAQPTETDPDAPIDGGVSLLIAAGIGYGIKKNKERKNNSSKDIQI
jgi:preprotein translocase subunit SecY